MRKREKTRTIHPNFMKIQPIDHRMDALALLKPLPSISKHPTSINETWRCPIRLTGKIRWIRTNFRQCRRSSRLMISISFRRSRTLHLRSKMRWSNNNQGEHCIKRKLRLIRLLNRLTKRSTIVWTSKR